MEGSFCQFLFKLFCATVNFTSGGEKDQINSPSAASNAINFPSSQALNNTLRSSIFPKRVFQLQPWLDKSCEDA